MAFPVVAATNSGNQATDATSHTINLPTGITAGDLLMIFFSLDGGTGISAVPSGWTQLAGSSSPSPGLVVMYKTASGSEGSTVSITSAASEQSAHVTYRITGWHGTTVPEISTVATGTSTAPNPASLNPTAWDVEDTLWIQVSAWDDGTTTVTDYNLANNQTTARANTSTGVGVAVATQGLASASRDLTNMSLSVAEAWKAYTIAVRPGTNVAPTANFTYTPTNLSVAFTDTSSDPDGTIASRSWNFGDGNTSTSTNPTHVYAASGNYTVTLTVTDNFGATDSEVKTVTANTAPTANFTYTPTNLLVDFTDTSTDPDGTIASRSWTFGDGASSTSTNPSHAYSAAGSYVVTLTVTDNLGGTDSESKTVVVTTAAPPPDITQGTGNSYLWKIFPKRTSTLTAGMTNSQVTIPLADTTYWPQGGSVIVENEIMTYSGKSVINGAGNLIGVIRAQSGTTAATHSSGVEVGLLGRHSLGLLSKHKIPTFPANGAITLNEQGRWQDKDWFVRCDFANYRELAELSIYAAPNSAGNVTTTLDEGGVAVARNTAVTAAKEKRSLTINNAQTAAGDVTVTLAGVAKTISLPGATTEQWQVVVTSGASYSGNVVMRTQADETQTLIHCDAGESASQVAAKIRNATHTGWVTSGSGSTVTFTGSTAGDKLGIRYTYFTNPGVTLSITQIRDGVAALTAIQVADQIRSTSFPNWVTGGTVGTATLTIEALEAGPQTGTFSYSAGTTGATSTSGLTQTTAGAATTTATIATAIRTTYSGNTYWSAGGTGAVVTFTALSDGAKQDATFTPGTTGTGGLMTTTRQGLPSVVAHIRDSAGVDDTRLIMANIATTTAFNIETSVSGAGTSKAVVSIFGSFGTDPLSLLWRKTKVDLSDHQAGYAAYGVVREFGSGITWDSHSDEVEPTSQAKVFHCDHTDNAELIGQARYYGRLDILQASNDLYVQGLSIPVKPGEEVVMAVKLRYENVPTELPAKPLFVTAHHADGTVTDLRDVTGTSGISGTAAWAEPTPYTFTVPGPGVTAYANQSPCYEIRVASRDMSTGFILWQQLVVSGGTLPKRTYYYATNGTVTVSYDGRTPQETNAMQLGRQRVALETQYNEPAGTLTSEQYRSVDDPDSLESADWHTNPLDVDDKPVVGAEITLQGDGLTTPELLSGYPRFEYQLLVGLNPQPVLLKPDGTEFPGIAILDKREEWYPATGYDIRQLPSGHNSRTKMHPPIGYIPKLSIGANRPEVVKLLNGSWGELILIADWVDDEVLTIGLLKNPELERTTTTRGDGPFRWSVWQSKEIDAEVYSVRKRIRS